MKALTQFYSVDKLVIGGSGRRGATVDFDDGLACQMQVMSPRLCQFVVTNPSRALDGPLKWQWPGELKSIEYTIIGSPDGQRVGFQRYKHEFTTRVRVDSDGICEAMTGALFIPYQLDVLLDSKGAFGRVQSIQFIA